jgi:hypothetical protein
MPISIDVLRQPLPEPPLAFRMDVVIKRAPLPPPPDPAVIRIELRRASEAAVSRGCQAVVGTWMWFNGATVNCGEGTCTASNGFTASWECTDPSGRFKIRWTGPHGDMFVDEVSVSGNSLQGTNQQGADISATRR